jgi:hypothetical protein
LSIDENSLFEGSSRRVENPTEPSSDDVKMPQEENMQRSALAPSLHRVEAPGSGGALARPPRSRWGNAELAAKVRERDPGAGGTKSRPGLSSVAITSAEPKVRSKADVVRQHQHGRRRSTPGSDAAKAALPGEVLKLR